MIQLEHSLVAGSQEPVDINELLPERPFIMGEFSPAYEAFKQVTIAGLAPATHYEYIQALQLVDLNWAILQRKASADLELSNGMKHAIKSQLLDMLRLEERKKHWHLYEAFLDEGGDEDDYDDPTDWEMVDKELERLMEGIFSKDALLREQVIAEVISRGVDPRMVLSAQYKENLNYRSHAGSLPELEKRVRLLSAEYRELQKARPIDVVSVPEG